MAWSELLSFRWLGVRYAPRPEDRPFLERAELQRDDQMEVQLAVLDSRESERFFGVRLARHGIQPVWIRIANHGQRDYRLRLASIDPNYYPPLEAAYSCHYRLGRRLLQFGLLAWLFLPLLLLVPFKVFGAWLANRKMNAFFVEQGIGRARITPGSELAGFVFTTLDQGTKLVTVRLLSDTGAKEYAFSAPIPGLKVDYHGKCFDMLGDSAQAIDCDLADLRHRLEQTARCTMNHHGTREGDPLNLVVIGEFDTILTGFGASWNETEAISLMSCWRTMMAFVRGSKYRYSPVSSLYALGRCQDFALQKIRQSINQRMHLRLWITSWRFEGKPVWIGQVSRDIGVRFTTRTWNLTTHKIDPDVDDARDYVLDELLQSAHVAQVGYVPGVGAAERKTPRQNLTGDTYFTDGMRAVAIFSGTRTKPTFLNWV